MSKLFGMENDSAVAEASVEKIEAITSAATTDADTMTEELAQADTVTDAAQAGVEAIEPLEEVEGLLTQAVESGDGLDQVSAEAVRIALTAICRPIGADAKRVYPLYAAENFSAGGTRMASTKLALEGATDFIKELYERIKASLKRMWEKAKAFWDKHFTTLGRMKKAVQSLKQKAKDAKGLKSGPFVEKTPSVFLSAFGPQGELTEKDVAARTDKAGELEAAVGAVYDRIDATVQGLKKGKANVDFKIGSDLIKVGGLVGGRGYRVFTEGEETKDEDTTVYIQFKIEKKDKPFEVSGDKGVRVMSIDAATKELDSLEKLIDVLTAARKKTEKRSAEISASLGEVGNMEKNQTNAAARRLLSYNYKLATFSDKLDSLVTAEVIRAVKASLSFVSFNLSQYKAA